MKVDVVLIERLHKAVLLGKKRVFMGFVITMLIYYLLEPYTKQIMYDFVISLRNGMNVSSLAIYYILSSVLVFVATFFFPRFVIKKGKRNVSSGFIIISMLLGIVLSIFSDVYKYVLNNVQYGYFYFVFGLFICMMYGFNFGIRKAHQQISLTVMDFWLIIDEEQMKTDDRHIRENDVKMIEATAIGPNYGALYIISYIARSIIIISFLLLFLVK